ncbi:MAG: aspartate kinase, partial [Polaribacter sp.]|nr:aspartate kinase [Polaribacter sp.]
MKVLKFGGSSVASSENIKKVINIIIAASKKQKVIVVVSAFGKTTNALIEGAHLAQNKNSGYKEIIQKLEKHHFDVIQELIPRQQQSKIVAHIKELFNQLETIYKGCYLLEELSQKTLATISSFGELLSAAIIAEISNLALDTNYKDSRDLIVASEVYLDAVVDFPATNKNITDYFKDATALVTLLPGFVARTNQGQTTTLGRGGSDYSAAIYAAALDAEELQIWTDVSGMYTSNPSIVKQAFAIPHISYHEAMELSHFGAKVIFPPTLQPLVEKQIPVFIKNTFAPQDQGTRIDSKVSKQNGSVVKGISHIDQISLISLEGSGMVGIPGVSKRLFEVLSIAQINVIMITQASSEHSICIAVQTNESQEAKKVIDAEFAFEISLNKVAPAKIEDELVNVAIVGDNMKNHQGISGKMFSSLGANNVNIRAIAQGASERNISIMINKKDTQKGLNTLHETFFENDIKELNLFIIGVGNVGSKLLEQILKQQEYLEENLLLRIKVIAISNSRTMVLGKENLNLKDWKNELEKGHPSDVNKFFEHAKNLNLRNSIFVDNTASASIAYEYERYLNNNIGVVTCNKIACADTLE